MTSTGERIVLGDPVTVIRKMFEHTEIIPYIVVDFSSDDLYEAFQQSQVATHKLKLSATADPPDSTVLQVGIIIPGYRVGAAHVLDAMSSAASHTLDDTIYEFCALAATETHCATTDADDNDDGAATDPPAPSRCYVATLQGLMQEFETANGG
jgi:hypothetical protein